MTIHLPEWSLNYHVAAFGAYATILVESIHLILRGFENASLLSISVLTNGSAVLVAGLGGPSSTSLAILRICLTSLFLLCAVILQGNERFDGTYAILYSVAHLIRQSVLLHYGHDSEGSLPRHRKLSTKIDEATSENCLHGLPTDDFDASISSRDLRIFFGNSFCLEGLMVPVTILGTAMIYRVFDFDLGFGLVFTFMSAFLSSLMLLFMNFARMRGRRMHAQKAIHRLVSLMVVIGTFCFVFFTTAQIPDIEFSWWKIAFGVAWFIFLFLTTYVACRFLIHATLLSCAACSQRQAGIQGPLTQEASAYCIWEDYTKLPALNEDEEHMSGGFRTFQIRRQKGADLVERFWLNDQELFQISPRSFVIFFVCCIALATFSGGALNLQGSFADIGSYVSNIATFYITVAFIMVSTGHTAVEESPELMFVSLIHSFPEWKATATAIITTMIVHFYLLFMAPANHFVMLITPLASTIMAPLLVAGVSSRLDPTEQEGRRGAGSEGKTVTVSYEEQVLPTGRNWTLDSALVYSSPRIRGFDFRVLLLGFSITLLDVLCNQVQGEKSLKRWPINAVISMSVTVTWLYLENLLPRCRDFEPGILTLAVAALVGNFDLVNFLDAIDNESSASDFDHTLPVLDNAGHSKSILIALWYSTLVSMVVVNRRSTRQKADETIPSTNGQAPKKDQLLFGFHVKTSKISFSWQLRNSRVASLLVFAMLASCLRESWPLEAYTTVASSLLFTLVVGFHLKPKCGDMDEKRSLHHVAALGFSALMTILAVGLNRYGVLHALLSEPRSNWKAGTWSALVFYWLFLAISLRLKSSGCFTRLNHADEPPQGSLQDEEKAMTRDREQQRVLDASDDD